MMRLGDKMMIMQIVTFRSWLNNRRNLNDRRLPHVPLTVPHISIT
jgi:hypothetical protein